MAVVKGFDAGYRRWRASTVHAELLGEGPREAVQPFSFVPLATPAGGSTTFRAWPVRAGRSRT
ncbi:MAG: hypothetical protein ACRDS0_24095 [Pseudonocardiaceae bacterium]